MPLSNLLEDAWHRLDSKHLLGIGASVSMRIPGTRDMLTGGPGHEPLRVSMAAGVESAHTLHAAIYRAREDVGAIVIGGGTYGRFLGEFGGHLPQVFDEQARHLGRTAEPLTTVGSNIQGDAKRCLQTGGNVWICGNQVLVFGATAQRLVLNAELLEKCAKAFVLATATGAKLHTLPWWVCRIANGRLKKDQRRATARFAQGLLPEEVKGY